MRKSSTPLLVIAIIVIGLLPVFNSSLGGILSWWLDYGTLAGISLCGWVLVAVFVFFRNESKSRISGLAKQFGIATSSTPFESLLAKVVREAERRTQAFSSELIESRISTRDQLSQILEQIVARAYALLSAESAELALHDEETGLYHSSFVLGQPFGSRAQAAFAPTSSAEDGNGQGVLIEPLSFAGTILGSLRVCLKRGNVPDSSDREVLKLLAVLGGLAIVNAQYTRELVRMKQASEENVRAKTGFLANLSHEIRGPLGIILNATELVLDGLVGEISNEQRDTLSMIKTNSDHLLELINDVLDYAKIESGKVTPEIHELPVCDFISDMALVVRAQAEAKKHTIHVKPFEEPIALRCDRRHARQMLINLLTNAIKYTPEGGDITLSAELLPGAKVRICVADNGIGIESKDREKVFAPFERLANAYALKQAGTGLGMSLTRKLVELNGGSIDFDSQPGHGSTFWINFRSTPLSAFTKSSENPAELEARGQGQLVLVLEQDSSERGMMVRYLKHRGFHVIDRGNCEETERILVEYPIKLALVGNLIVEESGGAILRLLREKGGAGLGIILVSSRAFPSDAQESLLQGVDRFVAKPVSLHHLGRICRELLDGAANKSELLPRKSQAKVTSVMH